MSWRRPVWVEDVSGKEWESTVPSCWVNDTLDTLRYPDSTHMNVKKAFKNHVISKPSCHHFDILKVKVHEGNETVYNQY